MKPKLFLPRCSKVAQTILHKTSPQWGLMICLGSSKTRRYGRVEGARSRAYTCSHEVTIGGTPTNIAWMSIGQRDQECAVISLCTGSLQWVGPQEVPLSLDAHRRLFQWTPENTKLKCSNPLCKMASYCIESTCSHLYILIIPTNTEMVLDKYQRL